MSSMWFHFILDVFRYVNEITPRINVCFFPSSFNMFISNIVSAAYNFHTIKQGYNALVVSFVNNIPGIHVPNPERIMILQSRIQAQFLLYTFITLFCMPYIRNTLYGFIKIDPKSNTSSSTVIILRFVLSLIIHPSSIELMEKSMYTSYKDVITQIDTVYDHVQSYESGQQLDNGDKVLEEDALPKKRATRRRKTRY